MAYYCYWTSCGTLNLVSSSPETTFTEPLSLEDVKAYLNLPDRSVNEADGLAENALLETYIAAAREVAEIMQGRDLVRKQYDLTLDYWTPTGWGIVPSIELRSPLVSVDLVQYTDSDGIVTPLVAGTDYIMDTAKTPGLIMPPYNQVWPTFTPWPSSAILIRFTSGVATDATFWQDAGQRIKTGMLMLISAWFNNRLPFEIGASAIQEYPMAVTACLSYGALSRMR